VRIKHKYNAYSLRCWDWSSAALTLRSRRRTPRANIIARAVVASTSLGPSLGVCERRHWVAHDAQVGASARLALHDTRSLNPPSPFGFTEITVPMPEIDVAIKPNFGCTTPAETTVRFRPSYIVIKMVAWLASNASSRSALFVYARRRR
jgi:hypothetical protein